MRLDKIPPSKGAKRPRKRIGRGRSSGHGKTSGRGHKGQKSRSGSSMRPGFESGHVPLYRRLPRRGFSNFKFRIEYTAVNIGVLDRIATEVDLVDREALIEAGLVRKNVQRIKILGKGEISRAVKVQAEKFSAAAAEKILKAGGEIITLGGGERVEPGVDDDAKTASDAAKEETES